MEYNINDLIFNVDQEGQAEVIATMEDGRLLHIFIACDVVNTIPSITYMLILDAAGDIVLPTTRINHSTAYEFLATLKLQKGGEDECIRN